MNAESHPPGPPLAGKIAVVTGGTKGLGLVIAEHLVSAGAQVVAASRNVNTHSELPTGLVFDRVDVTKHKSVNALMNRTVNRFGGLDIVVANAGVNENARFDYLSTEKWEKVVSTNFTGTFFTIQAATNVMKTRRTGHIITISSCMASHPPFGAAAYAASKSAISTLTFSAAFEMARYNININCVAPGILDVGLGQEVTSSPVWSGYLPHLISGRPGRADEIAKLIVFLVGPDSTYINGVTIPIDGGISTWGHSHDDSP